MKKKLLTYFLFSFALFFSCTEVEEPLLDNPYDPQNPDLEAPEAVIENTATVVNSTSVEFNWDGAESTSLFQFKLEGVDDNFSDWKDAKSTTYYNLDEGTYNFLVRERLLNEIEQSESNATSYSFTVDAVTELGLVLEKMQIDAPNGTNFRINLNVENADDVIGISAVITFDPDKVEFLGADENSGVPNIDDIGVLTKTIKQGEEQINILLLGTNWGFSGNASLCKLNFKSLSNSNSTIAFKSANSVLRNDANRDLNCNIFREATIN